MFSTVRIAPSILSANFMDMERDIRMLEEAGADIDVYKRQKLLHSATI